MTEKDKWWHESTGYYQWAQNIIVERRNNAEAERNQLLISLKSAEKTVEEVKEKLEKNDIEYEHLKKLNDDIGTGWLLRKEAQ